jgi:2-amino-4-hydroxy-6-hydroxymethyldihydropteridine diphosphokinase
MSIAFIGLGSNLGDREEMIGQALMRLRSVPDVKVVCVSPLYESPAMLKPDAPSAWDQPFLNAVAALDTELMPHTLLEILLEIENGLGRQRRDSEWAPRTIDLDILAYDDHVLDGITLVLPHPGMLVRDFVLLPWRDISPDWRYPVPGDDHGRTIAELCELLPEITAKAYETHV